MIEYSVFGLNADWEKDTEYNVDEPFNSLLNDSEIILLEGEKNMNNENKPFDNSFDPPMECSFQVSCPDICEKHNYRYLETIWENGEKKYVFYCIYCLKIMFTNV